MAIRDLLEEARRVWDRFGWPGTDAMVASSALLRAHQIIASRMDAILRPHGLSYARMELLIILYASKKGQLPLGKISERLMIHPTSVTGLVDRLEKDGLAVRVMNAKDRRGVLARITPEGRKKVMEIAPKLGEMQFGFADLGKKATQLITESLLPLRKSAGDIKEI